MGLSIPVAWTNRTSEVSRDVAGPHAHACREEGGARLNVPGTNAICSRVQTLLKVVWYAPWYLRGVHGAFRSLSEPAIPENAGTTPAGVRRSNDQGRALSDRQPPA